MCTLILYRFILSKDKISFFLAHIYFDQLGCGHGQCCLALQPIWSKYICVRKKLTLSLDKMNLYKINLYKRIDESLQ